MVSRASSRPSFQYTSAPPYPSPLRVVPSAPCLSSSSQVYGEPVAILAGDALLSQSFEVSAPPWSGEPLQLRHPSARHRAPRRTTAENARNLSPIRARAHEHPSRERGAASERARASGAERRERAADEGARVRERRAARARRRLRNEAFFLSLRRSLASPLSASSFARPRRLSLSLSLPSHAATPRLGFGRRVASTASLARSLFARRVRSCSVLTARREVHAQDGAGGAHRRGAAAETSAERQSSSSPLTPRRVLRVLRVVRRASLALAREIVGYVGRRCGGVSHPGVGRGHPRAPPLNVSSRTQRRPRRQQQRGGGLRRIAR